MISFSCFQLTVKSVVLSDLHLSKFCPWGMKEKCSRGIKEEGKMNCFFTSTMDDFFFFNSSDRSRRESGSILGRTSCVPQSEGLGGLRGNLDNASVPLCLHGKVKDQEVDKKIIQTHYIGIFKNPPCRKKSARLAKFA